MIVGFAGSGNMAAALARGWASEGGPEEMLFTDGGSGRAAELAGETGGRALAGLPELAARSDLIVLAVKPGALGEAAAGLDAFEGPLVSILGATTLESLAAALPGARLLRAMPNVGVEVGRGVVCHAPPGDPTALADALALLGRIARLVEVPEAQLDAATAVMGCSPAYLALACGSIADAGAEAGLEPRLAAELVAMSAEGTGRLLGRRAAVEVERAVASPGGSTEAGLEELEARATREAFAAAVGASLERMAGSR